MSHAIFFLWYTFITPLCLGLLKVIAQQIINLNSLRAIEKKIVSPNTVQASKVIILSSINLLLHDYIFTSPK